MPAPNGMTLSENFDVNPREIDFVSRFGRNVQALLDIMGISRPIRKEMGAVLRSKKASVVLAQSPAEGEEIPYSEATVITIPYAEMDLEKYSKGVTAESIKEHGYDVAVQKTDDAFLEELENGIMADYYGYVRTGALTALYSSYQMALAMAKGLVVNRFKAMHLTATEVVGFANVLDVYEYLGSANIMEQREFGFSYIKNFMGFNTIFLCADTEIPRGTIVATPVENIVLYYVDPASSDFARAGLNYTVDGETNLIGFHTEGNYRRAVSDAFALMGIKLFSEYLDGIAVVNVVASDASIGSLTVTSVAGSAVGKTKLTVTEDLIGGGALYVKAQATTAPSAPALGAQFDTTGWTKFASGDDVTLTNAQKFRVVEVNGAGQAVATGDGTVTAKT